MCFKSQIYFIFFRYEYNITTCKHCQKLIKQIKRELTKKETLHSQGFSN